MRNEHGCIYKWQRFFIFPITVWSGNFQLHFFFCKAEKGWGSEYQWSVSHSEASEVGDSDSREASKCLLRMAWDNIGTDHEQAICLWPLRDIYALYIPKMHFNTRSHKYYIMAGTFSIQNQSIIAESTNNSIFLEPLEWWLNGWNWYVTEYSSKCGG